MIRVKVMTRDMVMIRDMDMTNLVMIKDMDMTSLAMIRAMDMTNLDMDMIKDMVMISLVMINLDMVMTRVMAMAIKQLCVSLLLCFLLIPIESSTLFSQLLVSMFLIEHELHLRRFHTIQIQ